MTSGTRTALQLIDGGKDAPVREVLRELYAKYGGTVYGRCVYLLKDRTDGEDAMQDVFAKAIHRLTEFRQEASPLTWLMKIATHHCLNLLRSESAGWRSAFERQERAKGEGHGGPQVFETRDWVRHVLSQFDPETQAIAVHYHVDEMTLEEVAALVGRSVPTVRKRLEQFARKGGRELKS